jgi:hypothetical protein
MNRRELNSKIERANYKVESLSTEIDRYCKNTGSEAPPPGLAAAYAEAKVKLAALELEEMQQLQAYVLTKEGYEAARTNKKNARLIKNLLRRLINLKWKCSQDNINCSLTVSQLYDLWERSNAGDMVRPALKRRSADEGFSFENCYFTEGAPVQAKAQKIVKNKNLIKEKNRLTAVIDLLTLYEGGISLKELKKALKTKLKYIKQEINKN